MTRTKKKKTKAIKDFCIEAVVVRLHGLPPDIHVHIGPPILLLPPKLN